MGTEESLGDPASEESAPPTSLHLLTSALVWGSLPSKKVLSTFQRHPPAVSFLCSPSDHSMLRSCPTFPPFCLLLPRSHSYPFVVCGPPVYPFSFFSPSMIGTFSQSLCVACLERVFLWLFCLQKSHSLTFSSKHGLCQMKQKKYHSVETSGAGGGWTDSYVSICLMHTCSEQTCFSIVCIVMHAVPL